MLSMIHHIVNEQVTEADIRKQVAKAKQQLAQEGNFSHLRLLPPSVRYPYYAVMTFWRSRPTIKYTDSLFGELQAA